MREGFELGGVMVPPGEHKLIDLPVGKLTNHTPVDLPVHVVHGRRPGPVMFVSAAIHGDEVIGVEIIRRLLRARAISRVSGTLLCIPVVNAFGFISHSRYLPDRRDLNRTFPGTASGSLAGQIAHLFMTEIVQRADFGIDLHSAALHRTNLPQIRSSFSNERSRELATKFGAPIVLHAVNRDGSLRKAAQTFGVDVLVYEAGEALRLDEFGIRVGVQGILRVMKALGMIPRRSIADSKAVPAESHASSWMRAPEGGILRAFRTTGDRVQQDEVIGIVSNPFEPIETEVVASHGGIVIGRTNIPVVNQGDALFHIAKVKQAVTAHKVIGAVEEEVGAALMFDEDEII